MAALLAEQIPSASAQSNPKYSQNPNRRLQIGMVIFPRMIAQDFVGPHTVFAAMTNTDVHLVWKDLDPVKTDSGLTFTPTLTFDECPRYLDVLCIGGGSGGTLPLMTDDEVLDFMADRGSRALWVTSVCTGSTVLAAAGLLRGYKATSHWGTRDVLPYLDAEVVPGRIVEDRNRITAGGVTAGIDFGLYLAAKLRGQVEAESLQLLFEYNPQPPFNAGEPETAPLPALQRASAIYDRVRPPMIEAAAVARARWPK